MKNDKILIVCGADVVLSSAAHRLAKEYGAEIITVDNAKSRGFNISSRPEPIPIVAPLTFDMPYQPPLTRAERRKQQRKKP